MSDNVLRKTFDDIKAKAINEKTGKVKRSFSKGDFSRLTLALMNTPEHTTKIAKIKNGELNLEEIQPVKAYRNSIKEVLVDFGVDKQEGEKFVNEYKFKKAQAEPFYDFMCEAMETYMMTGKRLTLNPKEDYNASLIMEDVPASTDTYTAPNAQGTVSTGKVKKDAHKKIKVKSTVPKHKKTKVE